MAPQPILLTYDGSDNAAHAIAVAGELFGDRQHPVEAVLVHAWEPLASAAARSAVYAVAYDDTATMIEQERHHAAEVADRGAALANAAGFDAVAQSRSGSGPVWSTIVEAIEEVEPRLVVMGTRGLTGLRSVLSGSVSHHVTSHSKVPVLTVPLAGDE